MPARRSVSSTRDWAWSIEDREVPIRAFGTVQLPVISGRSSQLRGLRPVHKSSQSVCSGIIVKRLVLPALLHATAVADQNVCRRYLLQYHFRIR